MGVRRGRGCEMKVEEGGEHAEEMCNVLIITEALFEKRV